MDSESHTASNVVRSIRSLERKHLVSFHDLSDKSQAYVELRPQVEAVPEEHVFQVLTEIGERP